MVLLAIHEFTHGQERIRDIHAHINSISNEGVVSDVTPSVLVE